MANDDTVAACRAALLDCSPWLAELDKPFTGPPYWIRLDRAAACMARYGAECLKRGRTRTMLDEIEERDQMYLAALAAAQEVDNGK